MAIELISRVWLLILPPRSKLLLLALADHANEQGICWPGIDRLSAWTGLGPRQVQRILAELRAVGFVEVIAHAHGGRTHSTTHRLHLVKGDAGDTLSPVKGDAGDTLSPVKGDAGDTLSPVKGDAGDTLSPVKDDAGDTLSPVKGDAGDTLSPVKDDAQDAKGCHRRRKRVSPVTQKGVTHDTRTVMNRQGIIREVGKKPADSRGAPIEGDDGTKAEESNSPEMQVALKAYRDRCQLDLASIAQDWKQRHGGTLTIEAPEAAQ